MQHNLLIRYPFPLLFYTFYTCRYSFHTPSFIQFTFLLLFLLFPITVFPLFWFPLSWFSTLLVFPFTGFPWDYLCHLLLVPFPGFCLNLHSALLVDPLLFFSSSFNGIPPYRFPFYIISLSGFSRLWFSLHWCPPLLVFRCGCIFSFDDRSSVTRRLEIDGPILPQFSSLRLRFD